MERTFRQKTFQLHDLTNCLFQLNMGRVDVGMKDLTSISISLEERVNIEPYRADLIPVENFNSIHNNHDLPDNRDLPISRFNSMREEDFDSMHSRAPIIQQQNDPEELFDPKNDPEHGQNDDQNDPENNPEKASQDSKPPEDVPKPETILVGPFELVKEKIMAVPGLLRLIARVLT